MRTRKTVEHTKVEAAIHLDETERWLLYQYAYQELHVPEIIEEIVFLSDDGRTCILNCIKMLKTAFIDNDHPSIEPWGERGEC